MSQSTEGMSFAETVSRRVSLIAAEPRRLGDVVVELGFAEREMVEAIVALARVDGRPIGQALVEGNVIDSQQLAKALAERNGLEYVDLSQFEVDYAAASLISSDEIRRYGVIPIAFIDEHTPAGRHCRPFEPAWSRQREDRDRAKGLPGGLLTGGHPGADNTAFTVGRLRSRSRGRGRRGGRRRRLKGSSSRPPRTTARS